MFTVVTLAVIINRESLSISRLPVIGGRRAAGGGGGEISINGQSRCRATRLRLDSERSGMQIPIIIRRDSGYRAIITVK
jgi:hypothetical protein